jgi:hypothetical protein
MRRQALPPGVLDVIKLAAGLPEPMAQAKRETSLPADQLRDAAVLYLHQVVLHADADPRRVLGVNDDAGLDELRENRRWLLMWLHPDRNSDRWESAIFNRVQQAWMELSQADEPTVSERPARGARPSRAKHRRPAPMPWVRIPLEPEKRRNTAARLVKVALLSLLVILAGVPLAAEVRLQSGQASELAKRLVAWTQTLAQALERWAFSARPSGSRRMDPPRIAAEKDAGKGPATVPLSLNEVPGP